MTPQICQFATIANLVASVTRPIAGLFASSNDDGPAIVKLSEEWPTQRAADARIKEGDLLLIDTSNLERYKGQMVATILSGRGLVTVWARLPSGDMMEVNPHDPRDESFNTIILWDTFITRFGSCSAAVFARGLTWRDFDDLFLQTRGVTERQVELFRARSTPSERRRTLRPGDWVPIEVVPPNTLIRVLAPVGVTYPEVYRTYGAILHIDAERNATVVKHLTSPGSSFDDGWYGANQRGASTYKSNELAWYMTRAQIIASNMGVASVATHRKAVRRFYLQPENGLVSQIGELGKRTTGDQFRVETIKTNELARIQWQGEETFIICREVRRGRRDIVFVRPGLGMWTSGNTQTRDALNTAGVISVAESLGEQFAEHVAFLDPDRAKWPQIRDAIVAAGMTPPTHTVRLYAAVGQIGTSKECLGAMITHSNPWAAPNRVVWTDDPRIQPVLLGTYVVPVSIDEPFEWGEWHIIHNVLTQPPSEEARTALTKAGVDDIDNSWARIVWGLTSGVMGKVIQ